MLMLLLLFCAIKNDEFFLSFVFFRKGTSKLSTLSITREGAFFNGFKKKKRPTERI